MAGGVHQAQNGGFDATGVGSGKFAILKNIIQKKGACRDEGKLKLLVDK